MGVRSILSDASRAVLHFGEFRLDGLTRELWRGAVPLHLSPKALELLLYLVEQRPRALSKQELLDRFWPNTFICEATLTSVIAEIRGVLGDSARQPRFVRTVHRFGYAFCGSVSHTEAPSRSVRSSCCFLLGEVGQIALSEGENLVGRDGGASITIDAATVSRRHACIFVTDREAIVDDLRSKNGTFVEGKRLISPTRIRDGDRLLIGAVPLVFRVRRTSQSTLTSHR